MQALRRLVLLQVFRPADYAGYRFREDVIALLSAEVLVEVPR